MIAYHFTLNHKHSSIPMRANTWGFPAVKKARIINTRKSIKNAQSTISRNVGWREEPGCKMVEKKDSDALSGFGVDSDM